MGRRCGAERRCTRDEKLSRVARGTTTSLAREHQSRCCRRRPAPRSQMHLCLCALTCLPARACYRSASSPTARARRCARAGGLRGVAGRAARQRWSGRRPTRRSTAVDGRVVNVRGAASSSSPRGVRGFAGFFDYGPLAGAAPNIEGWWREWCTGARTSSASTSIIAAPAVGRRPATSTFSDPITLRVSPLPRRPARARADVDGETLGRVRARERRDGGGGRRWRTK